MTIKAAKTLDLTKNQHAVSSMIGRVFGRYTVVERDGSDTAGARYSCQCACGTVKTVRGSSLRNRSTQSCGCLNKEVISTHGMTGSRTYSSWRSMKGRCYRPKNNRYELYGGRGITVCDRWLKSFEAFLQDMGERPEGKTLDRIDSDGSYEPNNCKWSTPSEQNSNRRGYGTI